MSQELRILITASDKASDVMRGVAGEAEGLGGALGTALKGAALGAAAAIAGVGAAVAGFIKEAMGAQDAVAGLDAVLSATSKAAAEQAAAYNEALGKSTVVQSLSADELANLNEQLAEQQAQLTKGAAKIQEQKQRIWEMKNVWTDGGLAVKTAEADLAIMEQRQASLGRQIDQTNKKIADGGPKTVNLAKALGLTAPKAQMTREQLLELASSVQSYTRFSDEAVIEAEKLLLTFTEVGAETFPDVIKVSADMSAVLGTDLPNSTRLLGKALSDPVTGMNLLRRSGVVFTDAQEAMVKKMVESGDLMGAQQFILDSLKGRYEGAAKAAGETFSGQIDRAKNRLSDLMETIGGAILPGLQGLAEGFLGALNSERVTNAANEIAIAYGLIASGHVWSGIIHIGEAMGFTEEQMKPFADKFTELQQIFFLYVLPALEDVGEALMTALPVAFQFLQGVVAATIPVIQALIQGAMAAIGMMLQTASGWWAEHGAQVQAALGTLLGVVQGIGTAIAEFWAANGQAIVDGLGATFQWILNLATNLFTVLTEAMTLFGAIFTGNWEQVSLSITAIITTLANTIGTVIEGAKTVIVGVVSGLIPLIQQLGPKFLEGALALGTAIVNGIKQGIMNAIAGLLEAIRGAVAQAIAAAKAAAGIQSPSKEFAKVGASVMEGLAMGVTQQSWRPALATQQAVQSTINNTVYNNFDFALTTNAPTQGVLNDLSILRAQAGV